MSTNVQDFIKARISAGMTQTQIADQRGVAQSTINNIINRPGDGISLDVKMKVAAGFELPIDAFMQISNAKDQRLDSIERKLDRLLAILSPGSTMVDAGEAAVLASGGVKALQQYVKAESERRARHA